jgi:hypothetical protein
VGASQALHAAVSIDVLGVITGTAVLRAAIVWRSALPLLASRAPLSSFAGVTKGNDIMRMHAQPAWVDKRPTELSAMRTAIVSTFPPRPAGSAPSQPTCEGR